MMRGVTARIGACAMAVMTRLWRMGGVVHGDPFRVPERVNYTPAGHGPMMQIKTKDCLPHAPAMMDIEQLGRTPP
jgi:hypothetical protein